MLRHTRPQWSGLLYRNVDSILLKTPDLTPSDYYLFPKIKKELGGHHFARDDDVMNALDHFLRDQNGASIQKHRRGLR